MKVSTLGYPSILVRDTENQDTRLQTIDEVPSHLSESFLKHVSDSHLDKLYDLPEDIQDVMGLQALRPSAAVCKVMTIPNSNRVRIVTPDEHVNTGFHEILVYDMGQEEWPQVPLCDIGCPMIRLAEGFICVRGTLSVGTGANEKSVQGSLRTGGSWYVPYV